MMQQRSTLVRDLCILVIGAALLVLPDRGLRPAFSQGFCAVMNALVGHVTFGAGGHVEFQPKPPAAALANTAAALPARGGQTFDAEVKLTDDVTHASTRFLLDARGLGFIPLVLMVVAVLVMPLERRRRAVAGALASAALLGIVTAWISLMLVSVFSNQASMAVYQLQPLLKSALDWTIATVVTPLAARLIAPIGLGLSIVAWQLSRQKKLAQRNWQRSW
jgi:hypothetical protein